VFGNLCRTESLRGAFSAEDEELAIALAATAGAAIENARLFAETRRRQAWMAASADLPALIVAVGPEDRLGALADRTSDVAGADPVTVVLPRETADPLTEGLPDRVVAVARGRYADRVEGTRFTGSSLSAAIFESGQVTLLDAKTETVETDELLWIGGSGGSVMGISLRAEDRRLGVLFIARAPSRSVYRPSDVEVAADLAGQVSGAMELASARAELRVDAAAGSARAPTRRCRASRSCDRADPQGDLRPEQ